MCPYGLRLEVTGKRIEPDPVVLACRITGEDRWFRRCGGQGVSRDMVVRCLANKPYGCRSTILYVSVRRRRFQECAHAWRREIGQAAPPRVKLSRSAVRLALPGVDAHHLTMARMTKALGVSLNAANTVVLAERVRLLINDSARFEGGVSLA